jgi:hypothetical protein
LHGSYSFQNQETNNKSTSLSVPESSDLVTVKMVTARLEQWGKRRPSMTEHLAGERR